MKSEDQQQDSSDTAENIVKGDVKEDGTNVPNDADKNLVTEMPDSAGNTNKKQEEEDRPSQSNSDAMNVENANKAGAKEVSPGAKLDQASDSNKLAISTDNGPQGDGNATVAENAEASSTSQDDQNETSQKEHNSSALETQDQLDSANKMDQDKYIDTQENVDNEAPVDPKEKAKIKAKIKAKAKKARKKAEKEQINTHNKSLNDSQVSEADKNRASHETKPSGLDAEKAKELDEKVKGSNEADQNTGPSSNKENTDQADQLPESKDSAKEDADTDANDAKIEKNSTKKVSTDVEVPDPESKPQDPATIDGAEASKTEDDSVFASSNMADAKTQDKFEEAPENVTEDVPEPDDKFEEASEQMAEHNAPKQDNKFGEASENKAEGNAPKSEGKSDDVPTNGAIAEALKSDDKPQQAALKNRETDDSVLQSQHKEQDTKPLSSQEQKEVAKSSESSEAGSSKVEPTETTDHDVPKLETSETKHFKDSKDVTSVYTSGSTTSKYAPSVSAFSVMADRSLHGKLNNLPAEVQRNLHVKDYKIPPSINTKDDGKKPWDSSTWSSNRAFEMLNQQPKGRDSGSQWTAISGAGDTTSSISQEVTTDIIAALFVPDPRSWHPYRFVRRTNPRQVLVMCAGTALSPHQIKSTEVAHRVAAGMIPREEAAKSLASYYSTTENTNLQAGLGFIYSPDKAICDALHENFDATRVEKNFARRLERPEFPATTTRHRAALRSVIAALEYIRWEEEGFDKIVLATHHGWIVRGISHDIWEWRQNGWKFMRNSVLGLPGENVPDRDLWELLDYVVRQYESIDCNCRFWHIPKSANKEAIALAEMGALKTNQQPSTVRWTKSK
ncbi:hypothetical protein MEQU1_002387 [Malassezia equina]|uniref:RNase H type-1 domain-containing protein n=1 Tax=Malassezia equina TaxID=1381935 RepID=A0AAF0J0P7_9BASI|nr:hypothetical protein MEQU1_002387 [Malassezia equina]